jgi:hypothetical protein
MGAERWDKVGHALIALFFLVCTLDDPDFFGLACLFAVFVGPVWLALKLMALERDRGS